MTLRRTTALVTVACFTLVFPAREVRAAASSGAPHSVTHQALHEAVQSSHDQASAARSSLNDLLAKPEVREQVKRVGLAPERLTARVAGLSDSEVVRLHQQVMAADVQNLPAGLSNEAIILIVLAIGVIGTAILIWAAVQADDELYDYYY